VCYYPGEVMVITVSLGGSVIVGSGKPDVEFIKGFVSAVKDVVKKERIIIITGGGQPARDYAEAIRQFSKNEMLAHEMGTLITRVNAELLLRILQASKIDVYPKVLCDDRFTEEVRSALSKYKVVIGAGVVPGVTSDTDAVLLARASESRRLINISNVDGIYDKDPRRYSNAKKISRMTYDQFLKIILPQTHGRSGEHIIFDPYAAIMMKEDNIELHFVGPEIKEIKRAMLGKRHNGTVIRS